MLSSEPTPTAAPSRDSGPLIRWAGRETFLEPLISYKRGLWMAVIEIKPARSSLRIRRNRAVVPSCRPSKVQDPNRPAEERQGRNGDRLLAANKRPCRHQPNGGGRRKWHRVGGAAASDNSLARAFNASFGNRKERGCQHHPADQERLRPFG